jgi:CheY-like chemotaxis protein
MERQLSSRSSEIIIMAAQKILIVEDELHHGQQLKQVLEERGYKVLGPAPDCSAALELIWRERPDIAFVDTHLGSDTCEAVLDECDLQDVPVIIASPDQGELPSFCGERGRVNKPVETAGVGNALAALAG